MYPWMLGYPPTMFQFPDGKNDQDPVKMYKRWKKLLSGDNKDNKKDGKKEPWEQVNQAAQVLLVSLVFAGPVILIAFHMLSK